MKALAKRALLSGLLSVHWVLRRGVCMSAQASLNGREDIAQTARDSDGGNVFPETRHPKKRSRRASSKFTSAQEARLKPSKKLRTHSSKTHPSKEREKAWQVQHDRCLPSDTCAKLAATMETLPVHSPFLQM